MKGELFMNLEERQLKDKNRLIFIGCEVICLCIVLITVLNYTKETSTAVRIVISFVLMFIIAITYKYFKKKFIYIDCCSVAMIILYATTLLTCTNPETYALVYLIAIIVSLYHIKRVVLAGCAVAFTFLAIGHGILFNNDKITGSEFATEFIFTITACVLLTSITFMQFKHSKENMDELKGQTKKQIHISNTIIRLAEELNQKFIDAKQVSEKLNNTMNSNNNSILEIVSSTKEASEAIENQKEKTEDIQKSIQRVSKETRMMEEISNRTSSTVIEGVALINDLKDQSKEVEKVNNEAKETTQALNNSIKNVHEIIQTILGISNETNMLALNASIEASRAGDAGKGFAVVAEEIRTLSEETRIAVEKISNIIETLTNDAESASNSMLQSIEYTQKQNELITTTREKLEDIKNETDSMYRGVMQVNDSVDCVINANTIIVNSINNISATSQKIVTSTESALSECKVSMSALEGMNKLLYEISSISKNMENIEDK